MPETALALNLSPDLAHQEPELGPQVVVHDGVPERRAATRSKMARATSRLD